MEFKNKKYTRQGDAVDVIKVLDKGALINRPYVYYRGDEEHVEFEGPEYHEGELFDKCPTAPKVKTIEELKAGIAKYREEKEKLRNEVGCLKTELAETRKSIENHPELKRFVAFTEGRIKWVVINHYNGWTLQTFEQAMTLPKDDQYGRETLKLASAFGKSNGDVEYRINRYADGSGSWRNVWPFETEQEAKDFVRDHIEGLEKYGLYTFKTAENFGLELDPVKVLAYKEHLLNSYKTNHRNENERYLKRVQEQTDLETEVAVLKEKLGS